MGLYTFKMFHKKFVEKQRVRIKNNFLFDEKKECEALKLTQEVILKLSNISLWQCCMSFQYFVFEFLICSVLVWNQVFRHYFGHELVAENNLSNYISHFIDPMMIIFLIANDVLLAISDAPQWSSSHHNLRTIHSVCRKRLSVLFLVFIMFSHNTQSNYSVDLNLRVGRVQNPHTQRPITRVRCFFASFVPKGHHCWWVKQRPKDEFAFICLFSLVDFQLVFFRSFHIIPLLQWMSFGGRAQKRLCRRTQIGHKWNRLCSHPFFAHWLFPQHISCGFMCLQNMCNFASYFLTSSMTSCNLLFVYFAFLCGVLLFGSRCIRMPLSLPQTHTFFLVTVNLLRCVFGGQGGKFRHILHSLFKPWKLVGHHILSSDI